MWWTYAILSAVFAALTAIFAKVGLQNVNSDLATAIRTVVILFIAWGIVLYKNEGVGLQTLSKRSLFFLILSGVATGLSWLFYFRGLQLGKASQVAAVDKLSIVFVFILAIAFLNESFSLKAFTGIAMIAIGTWLMIK